MLDLLPGMDPVEVNSYRLIPSHFPPINLFDDVASADEFHHLFELQALTNPRLLNEVGNLQLIPPSEIPWGITGCSYATAPFTHVNPMGSRFSDGSFGILYVADSMTTALEEVRHHQSLYWQKANLDYDRLVFRGLRCEFDQCGFLDASNLTMDDPIYRADDYSASRVFGATAKQMKVPGFRYRSVRQQDGLCWALMTPSVVRRVVQAAHYEMIWNNEQITSVNKLTAA